MPSTANIASLTVRRIEQRLGKTLEIPPLSLTAQKILQLRTCPDVHVDQLTAIVESDPALAAQVMSWAASPLYSAPYKICSIEDAIVRALGFDLVMNLSLGLALGKKFSLPRHLQQDNISHWKHALYTAALIEGLTRQMPRDTRPEPGLAYLAGLLHNFGYLLLAYLFPPHFALIQQHLQASPGCKPQDIDQSMLGMTRDDICVTLLHLWNMPEELTTAIARQHHPDYTGPHATYALLLQLANLLLTAPDRAAVDEKQLDQLCRQLQLQPADSWQALDRVIAAEQALRALSEQMGHA